MASPFSSLLVFFKESGGGTAIRRAMYCDNVSRVLEDPVVICTESRVLPIDQAGGAILVLISLNNGEDNSTYIVKQATVAAEVGTQDTRSGKYEIRWGKLNSRRSLIYSEKRSVRFCKQDRQK